MIDALRHMHVNRRNHNVMEPDGTNKVKRELRFVRLNILLELTTIFPPD